MRHDEYHPAPVEGCFGCKVMGLGIDRGHLTRTTAVHSETGKFAGTQTEHRSGRVDAMARPELLRFTRKEHNARKE